MAAPGLLHPTRLDLVPTAGARTASAAFATTADSLFALALWNGVDPIIKERMFGLTNSEGNHGEDVKGYYYFLDSTPALLRGSLQVSAQNVPYDDLVKTNDQRTRQEPEYELIDTGVFDEVATSTFSSV
jgi:hypothetical protein